VSQTNVTHDYNRRCVVAAFGTVLLALLLWAVETLHGKGDGRNEADERCATLQSEGGIHGCWLGGKIVVPKDFLKSETQRNAKSHFKPDKPNF
jgi:hypothetical protein